MGPHERGAEISPASLPRAANEEVKNVLNPAFPPLVFSASVLGRAFAVPEVVQLVSDGVASVPNSPLRICCPIGIAPAWGIPTIRVPSIKVTARSKESVSRTVRLLDSL